MSKIKRESGTWLGVVLVMGLALGVDSDKIDVSIVKSDTRAMHHMPGLLFHNIAHERQKNRVFNYIETTSEEESIGSNEKNVYFQDVPKELFYSNKYPKNAPFISFPQPPPDGPREKYDDFCSSWLSVNFKKHWGVAVRMTAPDRDGERGLLCMVNMKSGFVDKDYFLPLCFTRASEIIRNASEAVQELLLPYNLTRFTMGDQLPHPYKKNSKWYLVPFPSELSLPIPERYDMELSIMAGYNIYHIYNDLTMVLMNKAYWGLSMDPRSCRFVLEQNSMSYGKFAHRIYSQLCSTLLVRNLRSWQKEAQKAPGTPHPPDFATEEVEPRPKLYYPLGWLNPLQDGFWPETGACFLNIYYKMYYSAFRDCKDWTLVKYSLDYLFNLIVAGLTPTLTDSQAIFSGKLKYSQAPGNDYWDSLDEKGGLQPGINVLYVDRLNEKVRRLQNSDELVESLRSVTKGKARFTVHDYQNMTLSDQLQIASTADIIVGVHGAGLTGSYWMKPGGAIIEIMSLIRHKKTEIRPGEMSCYKRSAKIRGLDYESSAAIIASPESELETYNWMGDEYILGQNASIPHVEGLVLSYIKRMRKKRA